MKAVPLTGSLGAEVTGVDLANVSDQDMATLDTLLDEYLVLCIRDQSLTPAGLLRLTERMGGVGDTPYLTGLPDYPDVVPVVKEASERSQHSFGAGWHTDFTFQARPPSRTLLYALAVPPAGGDTLYCNLYDAFSRLSDGLQDTLRNLNAVHSAVRSYGPRATLKDHMENMVINNDHAEPAEQVHPVVRLHPNTGREALWVNPTYVIRFENMNRAESEPLLHYLNQFAVQPSMTCRVHWTPGTLTMWDNRCTQHCATSDYRGHRREMLRTTVAGEVPMAASPA